MSGVTPNIYVTADLHLGHIALLDRREGSSHGRPEFADVNQMNETIIDNWNAVVRPHDKVYVLGDVAWGKKNLPLVGRLVGRKCLVGGNHDEFRLKDLAAYFYNVRGVKTMEDGEHKFALTHIPISWESEMRRFRGNAHGHLHRREINHWWYHNVCVELCAYAPVEWSVLKKAMLDAWIRDTMKWETRGDARPRH